MLELHDLHVSYGRIAALRGVSLSVAEGEIVTVVGGNGAGKTTALRTISGVLKPRSGRITFKGQSLVGLQPEQVVTRGISHSPEGRLIFGRLTIAENLRLGAYNRRDACRNPQGPRSDVRDVPRAVRTAKPACGNAQRW